MNGSWLASEVIGTDESKKKPKKTWDLINEMFDCDVNIEWQATSSLATYIGKRIGHRTVISEPDRYGFRYSRIRLGRYGIMVSLQ